VPEGLVDVIDSIAGYAGLTRSIECTDPQIDVAIHSSSNGRKVMFLANTGKTEKEVNVGQVYIDVFTEQETGPQISLAPYSVKVLEAVEP
jgi:beta-galactosidase GanA